MKFLAFLVSVNVVLGAKVDFDKGVDTRKHGQEDGHVQSPQDGVPAGLPPCAVGYNRSKNNKYRCTDIDECSHLPWNNCSQYHKCVNTPGSFYCTCPVGYNGSFPTCNDIDECKANTHTCTLNAKHGQVCNNTVGSFVCRCNAGWAPHYFPNFTHLNCTQVNECLGQTHNCHQGRGNCTDTIGSFTCKCNDGYFGNGVSCADVDECVLGLHSCHKDAECTDTVGSFECQCKVGFAGNGTNCTDINECNATGVPAITTNVSRGVQAGNNLCANTTAKCTNSYGSYYCACNAGYTGTGRDCVNVNECSENLDNCTAHSICTDTVGSYTCACKPGFKLANGTDGPNGTCIDINECYQNMLLRGGGTTSTTTGDGVRRPFVYGRFKQPKTSYSSLLSKTHDVRANHSAHGHAFISDTTIPNALCGDKADCFNNVGSYSCSCQRGYFGDGQSCQNMNECTSGLHNCDTNAHCQDTQGSFKCSCLPGYNGSGTAYSGGWPPIDGCWDFDECTNQTQAMLRWNLTNVSKIKEIPFNFTNLRACPTGAVCTNTVGSFACACGAGWEGNGSTCEDIDECTLNKHSCHKTAWCNNTAGSYTCHCKSGYISTNKGQMCVPSISMEVGQAPFKMIWNQTWKGTYWANNYGWSYIKFSDAFGLTPVVIVQVPVLGAREFYPRVRRVDKKGFEMQLVFANSTNGTEDDKFFHWLNKTVTVINYIAVIPGVSKLPDGTVVAAGQENYNKQMQRSSGCANKKEFWKKIVFPTYNQRPLLLSGLVGDRVNMEGKVNNFRGGGAPPKHFCTSAIRFNATWNESNNSNNSAWVTTICDGATENTNLGFEQIAWIAIGSNFSNATNSTSFYYNNWTATVNSTVKYASIIGRTNLTHAATEDYNYGQAFTNAPIVLHSKVSTNKFVVGRLELLGALGDKAKFKNQEDPACASTRRKEEYVNFFVAEKQFTI